MFRICGWRKNHDRSLVVIHRFKYCILNLRVFQNGKPLLHLYSKICHFPTADIVDTEIVHRISDQMPVKCRKEED